MTSPTTVTAPAPTPTEGAGGVLAAMSAAAVVVVGFVASINLAVPKLAAGSLHPSASGLLWIVDLYVVFFACLVIPGGAVGDRYGRKGVLLAGLGLFAVGAVISAAATGVPMMLVGRAVTGIGAAGVLPNSLAVLVHATPQAARSRAIAVWASATAGGGVVGNVGGGAILNAGSWRWLFAAAVPVALLCAAASARWAPRTPRHARELDPVAGGLLTLATLALLVGIVQGPEDGWTSPSVVGGFVAAPLLCAAWVVRELRAREPLLDPRLLRIGRLRSACLGMATAFFGLFALFYVNASLLQYGRGYSVLATGLGIVPLTVPLLLGARRVPGLVARVGPVPVTAMAFACIGGGLIGLSTTGTHAPYAVYAAWLVVVGTGSMLALPVLTATIASELPAAQAGVGAGLQATTRELGSALGVAVVGTILTSRFVAGLPAGLQGRGSPPRTVAAALQVATDPGLRAGVLHAFVSAAQTSLRVVGIVTLVAGALVTARSRPEAGRSDLRGAAAP